MKTEMICFNPFFQVFFLNQENQNQKLLYIIQFQSLFSGLLFKYCKTIEELKKAYKFQSLFSGLLFKFV